MTSQAEGQKRPLYDLVEDSIVSLLVAGAIAAVLVMIDAPSRTVLATMLGAPGIYFVGRRFRRQRSQKLSS